MPTYDYVCTVCSYEFEEFQKMSDAHLTECPKCKSELRRKIGGGTGLHFKGSGFYITDYKDKPGASKKSKETKPAKETKKPAPEKKEK